MKKSKYQLRDSPFFRLRSKAKLANLLQISSGKLQNLTKLENRYIHFEKPKKDGKMRCICAPIPPLKKVQSRISDLLKRVETPDYLFAPVEGRSYVDNAAHHIGAQSVHLLDIEDFFPSCTINKVIWFFRSRLECSPDVSAILANIVTYNGVLPQGSPCSPILAYFTYVDMWDEINSQVKLKNCRLSVYADDLTISGDTIPRAMIWELKKILRKHGHKYAPHKEKARHNKPSEITGVILNKNGVTIPNRQRMKIYDVRKDLKTEKSLQKVKTLEAQLRGRLAQLEQVTSGNNR